MGLDHLNPGIAVVLLPVRGRGPTTHLVRESAGVLGRSLCGKAGPPNRYAIARWTRVYAGEHRCNACFASACRFVSRVRWTR